MAVTEKEYNSIIQYVRRCDNEAELTTYAGWKESTKGKKKKEKVVYTEAWKKWWNTWPSTKSVPGTEYISGAKMKGAEDKMHDKWYNATNSGKISEDMMQYAAECYLQWAYEDSKRLGRNELHYRNGMEPWLNQEQYLIYGKIEKPKIKVEVTTSTDM